MLLNPPPATPGPSFGKKSVVVLSAKLDAVNLFENAEIGAESPATGQKREIMFWCQSFVP
jgi:hypothetical protein